ncbi:MULTISPECIES: flavin monoamine oxidase family protein [Rhizobium]|uniref:flavin monoamine oxidase family protein n=1 Tax=Rhizobium TaxID=379 RepID=UPI00234FA9CC|nr:MULTISPECIES: NAD(P)/FAD-dependent oxidoreductase [unclassified Rhizobium]MDC7742590.1 NAD(P)/FAD-dependent oxidoreductase [Rhizobium sp. BC56]MDC9812019.1 NAD(P)/FAD-dependent oxidoreductase [Rhizobium sp. MC62]WEA27308.1 NAD(P)/FAD-dependent oxidoreductase [Rhizobium sp. MJ22]WEA61782.1 NAD(P)/FAD-dependent oxidoreductase [Rhizobium sp. BJ04]
MDFEVAIIGAGAAGISAARMLTSLGRKVVVIEASSRVGGRAWTNEIYGLPLDMGCGWLHSGERNPLVDMARAEGFDVVEGRTAWQDQWRDLGFAPDDRKAALEAWAGMSKQMERDPPASDRASDALDPAGKWNAYCQSLSGYLNGAPLDSLSVEDFLAYDKAATQSNLRVREGYGTLLVRSMPPVPLYLSCAARKVRQTRTGVRIETDRGTVDSRAVIVTVSTAVLARALIEFDAEMDDHLHAAGNLPLGLADKLFFHLEGNHGLEAETHLLGNPANDKTGSYYIRPLGRPIVEGFFGGPGAIAIEDAGVLEAFTFAIEELTALLGGKIEKYLKPISSSSWCNVEWIHGSYSHALPGCARDRETLAKPVSERLFFAGEATSRFDFSTAHGAWESGIRAVQEFAACYPKAVAP